MMKSVRARYKKQDIEVGAQAGHGPFNLSTHGQRQENLCRFEVSLYEWQVPGQLGQHREPVSKKKKEVGPERLSWHNIYPTGNAAQLNEAHHCSSYIKSGDYWAWVSRTTVCCPGLRCQPTSLVNKLACYNWETWATQSQQKLQHDVARAIGDLSMPAPAHTCGHELGVKVGQLEHLHFYLWTTLRRTVLMHAPTWTTQGNPFLKNDTREVRATNVVHFGKRL